MSDPNFNYHQPRFESFSQHGPYRLTTDSAHPFPRQLSRPLLSQLISSVWQQVTGTGRVLHAPRRQNDLLLGWPSVIDDQPLEWLAGGFVWANHQPLPKLNDLRPTLQFYDWPLLITTGQRRTQAVAFLNDQFVNQWHVIALHRINNTTLDVTIDATAGNSHGYRDPLAKPLAHGHLLTKEQLILTLQTYADDHPTWRSFLLNQDWSHVRKNDLLSIVETNSTSEQQNDLRLAFNQALWSHHQHRTIPSPREWILTSAQHNFHE